MSTNNYNYAKFMKDLLSRKGNGSEASKIILNEQCSTVVLNKVLPKEKDPGGDLKPTRMCIKPEKKTTQFPKGIAENVMVKIDKFIFSVNFVILNMEEDHRIPIILGRPFLSTAHTMIDVFNKKISFKVGDEIITFYLEKSMRFPPSDENTCHFADIIDISIVDSIKEILPQNHDNSIEPILDHLPEDCNNPDFFTTNSIDEEIHILKLKELPSHLEYAFLD
ncbi:putative reverse transcriptase domain-containing protein, partial [Tanacetum coccineum]